MNTKTLLIISVALNVILGVAHSLKREAPLPVSPPEAQRNTDQTAVIAKAEPAVKVDRQVVTNTVLKKFTWESVESADYKEYIANLRSVGCPEDTIRDVITADVNKLYDQKKKQIRGEPKEFEFWKSGNPFAMMYDVDNLEKNRELDKEKNALLRALGIEPDMKTAMSAMVNPMETMMDFLPESKKAKVMELMGKMQTKMAKAMKDGQPDPEVIQKAQKEIEDAIAKELTPDEFFDYQMRFSQTANMLRSRTAGFDPTKEEFVSLYNLQKEFDNEHSMFARGNETKAEREIREKDQKLLDESTKQTLGDGRYEDFKRSQDYAFRQIHQAAKRADLGNAEAIKVYEMKKLAEKQVADLRRNKALDAAERNNVLSGIRDETERSIKAVLGEKGWKSYSRNNNNTSWLDRIKRKPEPDAVPAPAVEIKIQ